MVSLLQPSHVDDITVYSLVQIGFLQNFRVSSSIIDSIHLSKVTFSYSDFYMSSFDMDMDLTAVKIKQNHFSLLVFLIYLILKNDVFPAIKVMIHIV